MRIICGKYKGRTLKMPKGIRPTQDKVRKALFDILADVKGLLFLDLFAGSGAVGIEALSQGAGEVVFVEQDIRCVEQIKENLSGIRVSGYPGIQVSRCFIIRSDALLAMKQLHKGARKFNIIFLDPPYYRDLAKKTLQMLNPYDILAKNGLAIVQHFKKDSLPESIENLALWRQAKYGDTLLSFYKKVTPAK